jgi:hypothetical protein
MRPYEFPTFAAACEQLSHRLRFKSKLVHSARWQGSDIASRPEMATHELTHTAFCVPLPHEDRDLYAADIRPNMPWAEDHFRERICGQPINPGAEWENWPYNKSAATFFSAMTLTLDKRICLSGFLKILAEGRSGHPALSAITSSCEKDGSTLTTIFVPATSSDTSATTST